MVLTTTSATTTSTPNTNTYTSVSADAEAEAGGHASREAAAAAQRKKLKKWEGELGKGVVLMTEEQFENLLDKMDLEGGLPDTLLFPLNMSDQVALSVLQGSFSRDGRPSRVGLGASWWWCDHAMGIRNTLSAVASFGVLSQFIGMTTDSRSILSFVRHDYFRRLLCSWLEEQNRRLQWELTPAQLGTYIKNICFENANRKIHRG